MMSAFCQLADFDHLLRRHSADVGIHQSLDAEADVWNLIVSAMRWCDLVGLDYERIMDEARSFHRDNPLDLTPVSTFEPAVQAYACV